MIWENNCSCVVMLCETMEIGQVLLSVIHYFASHQLAVSLYLFLPNVKIHLFLFSFLNKEESSYCFWPQSVGEENIFGTLGCPLEE